MAEPIELREHSTSTPGAKAQPSTPSGASSPVTPPPPQSSPPAHDHSHNGDVHHEQGHHHEHSHGIFGHSHSHGEDEHGMELMETLRSAGDKGVRITVIGLVANVLLTGTKGLAGWFMNSAALLAEAGHSLSDLLGDFVVLFSWRLSRSPPSERYPYGLAKFETFGTTVVALLLLSGGLGIGVHSLQLLLHALSETAQTLPPGAIQTALENVTAIAHNIPAVVAGGHSHGEVHAAGAGVLDPNAAWFAAVSVVAKEWLFRITRKVATEEGSPVLMANAYHHRSDAYSSAVALVAILGSTFFPALPLDPLGGLLVSAVIMRQGGSIFAGAFKEMTDASAPAPTLRAIEKALDPLLLPEGSGTEILGVDRLRARRAGSQLFVDLSARVRPEMSAVALAVLEERVAAAVKAARKDVKEVAVRFVPVELQSAPAVDAETEGRT